MADDQKRTRGYREAGVDIDAATDALQRIKARAHATFPASGAAAPIGHFGGVYRLPAGPDRALVASADGIGTKIKLAFVLGGAAHARVGADLVNHCLNDILACGAEPLFFLDYVAMGRLDQTVLVDLVGGMADACAGAGMALIGGETAEMPGLYADGEYDAAGFIVGQVEPAALIDGSRVRPGDVVLGIGSAGLHTNGYSLARSLLGLTGDAPSDRARLAQPCPGSGSGSGSYGDALMAPHRSYRPEVRPMLQAGIVHGMAHITGGGLLDNLPRMLPADCAVEIDPSTWHAPPIFDALVQLGELPAREAYRTFNMGIGFAVAVAERDVDAARAASPEATPIGRVVEHLDPDAPRVRGLT